jgi:hypothetical protein
VSGAIFIGRRFAGQPFFFCLHFTQGDTMATKDFGAERQRLRTMAYAARELIAEIDKRHPPTMPALNATDREIGAHIGQRQLIEWLQTLVHEADAQAGPLGRALTPQ